MVEVTNIIVFLLVGLISGWLADVVVPGIAFGLLGDLIVGIVGALIGGLIFSSLGIGSAGFLWSILAAFIGAVILLVTVRFIRRH